MLPFTPRITAALAASVSAVCVLAAPAGAQSPSYGDPYSSVIIAAPSPYWGYTYNPYVSNPYASMLHGAAAVTRANADYFLITQKAAKLREEVRRDKLKTRRLQLEHWAWELEFKAEVHNRERERIYKAELERARTLPPQTEILDAVSLNRIFDELCQRPDLHRGGSTKVETEWLAHIHVTVDGRGNVGLLKGDRIFWPELLTRSDFVPFRDPINQLLMRAKEQALATQNHARIDPSLLLELRQCLAKCRDHLDRERKDTGHPDPAWNQRHFTEASRFLRQVKDTIPVLEKPNAAMYFNSLRGGTVAELVEYMKKEGISFAAATEGCDQYYIALQRVLAQELTCPSRSNRRRSDLCCARPSLCCAYSTTTRPMANGCVFAQNASSSVEPTARSASLTMGQSPDSTRNWFASASATAFAGHSSI